MRLDVPSDRHRLLQHFMERPRETWVTFSSNYGRDIRQGQTFVKTNSWLDPDWVTLVLYKFRSNGQNETKPKTPAATWMLSAFQWQKQLHWCPENCPNWRFSQWKKTGQVMEGKNWTDYTKEKLNIWNVDWTSYTGIKKVDRLQRGKLNWLSKAKNTSESWHKQKLNRLHRQ